MPQWWVGIEDGDHQRAFVTSEGALSVDLGTSAPIPEPIATYPGNDPTIVGAYMYVLADAPGVEGTTNNFVTLFNPVGSGRVFTINRFDFHCYSIAAAQVRESMKAQRISTSTGGTDSSANIFQADTSQAAPVGVVRVDNPSVTLEPGLFYSSPPVVTAGTGSADGKVVTGTAGNPPVLRPGEGFVLYTEDGDIDQTWNLIFAWFER